MAMTDKTQNSALVPVEEKQVLFYEDEITAVLVEIKDTRQVYIPLRPICKRLGVTWPSQLNRIHRDPVLSKKLKGVFVMNTPGGRQEMSCLPLEYLNGWLFGINANRVNAEIRERLIRYQEECYRVLAEAFQEGQLTADPAFSDLLKSDSEAVQAYRMALAIVKLARNQILLESRLDNHEKIIGKHSERLEQIETVLGSPDHTITPDQASQLSQAVKTVAIALGKQTKKNEFGAVYGEMYRKFGITSYKLLPANRFTETMTWLTEWHQQIAGDAPF